MESVQRKIEIERVVNLIKGFGWELVSTKEEDVILEISFKKTIEPPMRVG